MNISDRPPIESMSDRLTYDLTTIDLHFRCHPDPETINSSPAEALIDPIFVTEGAIPVRWRVHVANNPRS